MQKLFDEWLKEPLLPTQKSPKEAVQIYLRRLLTLIIIVAANILGWIIIAYDLFWAFLIFAGVLLFIFYFRNRKINISNLIISFVQGELLSFQYIGLILTIVTISISIVFIFRRGVISPESAPDALVAAGILTPTSTPTFVPTLTPTSPSILTSTFVPTSTPTSTSILTPTFVPTSTPTSTSSQSASLEPIQIAIADFSASIFEEPSSDSEELAIISQEEAVIVIEQQGNWIMVRNYEGVEGWSVINRFEVTTGFIATIEGMPEALILETAAYNLDMFFELDYLDFGTDVFVLGRSPDEEWLFIRTFGGTSGWVQTDNIRVGPEISGLYVFDFDDVVVNQYYYWYGYYYGSVSSPPLPTPPPFLTPPPYPPPPPFPTATSASP